MIYVIGILLGIGFGSGSHAESGMFLGGFIGFAIAWSYSLSQSIKAMRAKITALEQQPRLIRQDESEVISNKTTDQLEEDTSQQISDPVYLSPVALKNDESVVTEKVIEEYQSEAHIEVVDQDGLKSTNVESTKVETTKVENPKEEKSKQAKVVKEIKPDAFDEMLKKAKETIFGYFTGGNSLVRIGMLVLFVGIAFLLKYVAQRTTFPIEYRYYGIVLASFVMLFLGWRLRNKRRGYALSLQGGGIGLLYLTLFAAMRIHQLLPASTVMILLVVIVVATAFLAVIQDSLAFAVIGLIGGFAAPILTSTGQGSHVHLFSYYLLLDLGVFFIAWFKSWRILNLVGFVATFGIGTAWGYQYYKPEYFNTVEPFLIAYFVLYTVIAVLFAFKQMPKLRGINDSTLVFGTPLVAFSLQESLLEGSKYGLSYSALAVSGFYGVLVLIINALHKPYMKTLSESFTVLAIGFATLAVPLAFDGRVTSAIWVLEAAAMAWIGIKQKRALPRFSGYLLTVFGVAAYIFEPVSSTLQMPWLNAGYMGVLLVTFATAFVGYNIRLNKDRLFKFEEPYISNSMVVIALLFWIFGGAHEISKYYRPSMFILLQVFYVSTVVGLLYFIHKSKYLFLKNGVLFVAFMMLVALIYVPNESIQSTALLNQRFMGLLVLTLGFYLMAWFFQHKVSLVLNKEKIIPIGLLLVAVFLWTITGLTEIKNSVPYAYQVNVAIVFILCSFLLQILLAHRINWQYLRWAKYLMLPVIVVMAMIALDRIGNFHQFYGWLLWMLVFAGNYFILKKYRNHWAINIETYHLVSLLLFGFILIVEGGELVSSLFGNNSIWFVSSYAFTLLVLSTGLYWLRNNKSYPLATYPSAYYTYGLPIMLLVLWMIVIVINLMPSGKLEKLPYIPLLNPIDITSFSGLFLIWKVFKQNARVFFIESSKTIKALLALSVFLVINATMLRSFHYWYGIEYHLQPMFSSFIVQTGLSILWTVSAVVLMIYSTRKKQRNAWMVGMGLIIVVVVKLFLVDMSASGSIERIVAFLSVGLLLSLVGYYSPIPPEEKQDMLKHK